MKRWGVFACVCALVMTACEGPGGGGGPVVVPDVLVDSGVDGQVDTPVGDLPLPDVELDVPGDLPLPDVELDVDLDTPLPDVDLDTPIPDAPEPDTPLPDADLDAPLPDGLTDVPVTDVPLPDVAPDVPATDVVPDVALDVPDVTPPACSPPCQAGETCTSFGECVTTVVPATCAEAHGVTGCCGPNGSIYWWDGGLQGAEGNCGDNPCGWDAANGYYSCGGTGFTGEDPSGEYPWECGDNLGQTLDECQCTPDCTGKQCGPDGCGGTCGSCGPGQTCDDVTTGQCWAEDVTCDTSGDSCTSPSACQCVGCVDDGSCTTADDCVCADCAGDSFCGDAANCNNDGVCTPYAEGCACADCAGHPSCP